MASFSKKNPAKPSLRGINTLDKSASTPLSLTALKSEINYSPFEAFIELVQVPPKLLFRFPSVEYLSNPES